MSEPAARPVEQAAPAESGAVKLDVLFRDQQHLLVRFFARHRASSSDAQDLAQETFLRFTRADQAAPGTLEKPVEFLRTIALNLLRKRVRATVRHHESAHFIPDDDEIVAPDELRRLEARDSLARLEVAMERLNPKTRDVFFAHRLHGKSYAEIADAMGMTVKGVEKQMSKAIAHIDRWVGQP